MDYLSYSNQCKGNYFLLKDSFNVLSSDGKSWGCSGLTGPFKWFGGAAFYEKSAHIIDFSKNAHNQNNKRLFANIHDFKRLINESDEFRELVRNPYVVNTEASYFGSTNGLYQLTQALNGMLKEFFGQEGKDVFYNIQEDGNMNVNVDAIRGKDLVMFYPFAEKSSLTGLKNIGESLMRSNAPNSIIGLFLTGIVPDANGNVPIFNVNDFR